MARANLRATADLIAQFVEAQKVYTAVLAFPADTMSLYVCLCAFVGRRARAGGAIEHRWGSAGARLRPARVPVR